MAEDLASQRRITAVEKRKKALQLRKGGASYDAIARQVGYTNRGSAHRAVMQELRDLPKDAAVETLQLEVERLDQMLLAYWPAVMKGHVRSGEIVVRLMERRAKLLGLDAPTLSKVEVVTESVVDAAIAELEAQIDARARAEG